MALAVAYEEAKTRQERHERPGRFSTGGLLNTPFFSFPNDADMPHATLNKHDAGRYSSAHYHVRDQFQVIVDGRAKFGRHDVAPYCVHFARAYTPYGPLNMDVKDGLTFFAMRAHRDAGAQRLPDKQEVLKSVAGRQPWQLTRRFEFVPVPAGRDYVLHADEAMQDSMGLAAYSLNMQPNASAQAPDPSQTDGQYVVVLKGSLQHEGKEYNAPALVFIRPGEGAFPLNAGSAGMEGLILNFPRPSGRAALQPDAPEHPNAQTWQCDLCSFVYDEAKGMPDEGIAAGTRWEDIPDDWTCPDCSAHKQDFRKAERNG